MSGATSSLMHIFAPSMEQQHKYIWADNMRITATTGVILLHIAATLLPEFNHTDISGWWAANIYNSSVRFCVPLFVMLSGALLLPKEYPLKDFLKKKLIRIVLPFLFWSFIYIVRKYQFLTSVHSMNIADSIKWIFAQVKNGSTSYHLWYVYMIIGIYLFIPVIGKWARNSSEKEILYFLVLWLLTLFLSQPLIEDYNPEFDLSYFSGFIGYLVLGYYLSVKSFADPAKITRIALLLIFLSIAFTAAGTWLLSLSKGRYAPYFHGNFSPNVLLLSMGVFLYFKNRRRTGIAATAAGRFISQYSFGIYLIHVLVIKYLNIPILNPPLLHPLIWIPLKTLVCLLISATIISFIHKIPYGKYIAG